MPGDEHGLATRDRSILHVQPLDQLWPLEPIEELVVAQVQDALSAPHFVQAVWNKVREHRPEFSEPEVVVPMRQLATMWPQLFPAEQCRLVQLLIERVVLGDTGMEIVWRDSGWQELA